MFIRKRERTDNFYQELQNETLHRLQELSGDLWTDFNVHDPGVTISDNMNYALFELQYKLELPFRAFLGPDTSYADKGILPGEAIFAPSIVTPEDYEELFLSDAYLGKYLESCSVDFDSGFYKISASVSVKNPEISGENIKEHLFVLFHENRNLCEDLRWTDIIVTTKSSGRRQHKQEKDTHIEELYNQEVPEKPIKIHDYYSFQLDFPDVYGIGERGLPPEANERNIEHVFQLKGYLLLMDFLMADTTQQIQHTPQLISFTETPPDGTVSKISIPDFDIVVDTKKFNKSNQLQTPASIQNKKSGVIDILDTLYGEDTAQFFQDFHPRLPKNKYRATLTKELPELNRNRFRSFNKLKPTESSIVFKELFSLLHGRKMESEIPVRDLLQKHNLDLLPDSVFFDQYEVYLDIAPISGVFYNPIFNETPQRIPYREMEWKEEFFPSLQNEISLIRRNALFESFLEVGANQENYRMIQLSENGRWILVFRYPGKEDWMILGTYKTKDHLIRSASRFLAFIRFLDPERHLFYLVEHRLLQYAYPTKKDSADANTLSIITFKRSENEKTHERLELLMKERLPAHLRIHLYEVEPDSMHDFEQVYYQWRKAMANQNIKKLIHFSESIRAFFKLSNQSLKVIQ